MPFDFQLPERRDGEEPITRDKVGALTDALGVQLQNETGIVISRADYVKIWNAVCKWGRVPEFAISGFADV